MEALNQGTKLCPFCGESIQQVAIKCRICNEMLAGREPVGAKQKGSSEGSETPRKNRAAPLRWLLGLGVAIAIVFSISKMNTGSRSGLTSGSQPGVQPLVNEPSLARLIAKPQVVVDEEVAVGAGGWQSRGFTLPSARPIQVIADGRTHVDKGFAIYVMTSDELDHFRNRARFLHVPALQGLKVRSFRQTATLPAGAWTVVVQNSENIINTMVVQLRVVSNPG